MASPANLFSSQGAKQRQQPHAKQQGEQTVRPHESTGRAGAHKTSLEDIPKDSLVTMKNKAMYEQAVRGEQPGLMLMQDKLGGDNVENSWGMTEKNEEPEVQT